MLHHTAGGLLTPLQASSILSCAVAHINERPLIVHGAPDEMGILTPWFLSARNMSTFHSQHIEEQDNLEHSLSRRAFQAQERLDLFRGVFNVFYHKEMVKFGHWNTQGKRPEVGDVCLILDKVKGKAHFLQKFQLGKPSPSASSCDDIVRHLFFMQSRPNLVIFERFLFFWSVYDRFPTYTHGVKI